MLCEGISTMSATVFYAKFFFFKKAAKCQTSR